MTNKYDWLLRKTPRSVDGIKLWPENPRLNPEEEYQTVIDFAEEMTLEDSDRKDFIALAKSIVEKGFIPADPVVLWQHDRTKKYYVAEGNRRVLALKLLRKPKTAPKSIRATIVKLSQRIDANSIYKIPVAIAPTFEDAEWYISQRNSMTSQKRWEAEQQRRWVMELYLKYNGNIDVIRSKIDLSEPELQKNIRILKLKELVKEVKEKLTRNEFKKAISMRFPITTFERFFTSSIVKEKWGIEFEEYEFKINSIYSSFLAAFAILIKRIILPIGTEGKIDSRSLGKLEDIKSILETLPQVLFKQEENGSSGSPEDENSNGRSNSENGEPKSDSSPDPNPEPEPKPKDDPNRNRLIHNSYSVLSDQYRLVDVFDELKEVPFRYPNSIAASIRIFLDLAVLNYIKTEDIEDDITMKYKCGLREITLKQRLEFIKQKNTNPKVENVLGKFLNPSNQFSLDVLNGYQHNADHHFIDKKHLNQFWDFLFPLFKMLVEVKENE